MPRNATRIAVVVLAPLLILGGLAAIANRTDRADTRPRPAAAQTPPPPSPTSAPPDTSTPTTTSPTTTTTPTPSTVLYVYPHFVSVQYPSVASPGTTIRLGGTCSQPLTEVDSSAIWVSHPTGAWQGFTAEGALDVIHDGDRFYADWSIPADQALGVYDLQMTCDAPGDQLDGLGDPLSASPLLTIRIAAAIVPETA